MIIAVTGTPGVGKTTLAKKIAYRYKLKYIDFESLLISKGFYIKYDELRHSYVIDIEKAKKYFENYSFRDSVLDGHNILLIYPCDRIDKVVLLRCSPYVLEQRLRRKGFNELKIKENVQSEILDIVASDVYSSCNVEKILEVDITGGISSKYSKITAFIEGKIDYSKSDKIDWLELVRRNNDFNKFF